MRADVKQVRKDMYMGLASICFDCRRACGGCSWSEIDPKTGHPRFQPPEGCVTENYVRSDRKSADGEFRTTRIVSCPLFVPDELLRGM